VGIGDLQLSECLISASVPPAVIVDGNVKSPRVSDIDHQADAQPVAEGVSTRRRALTRAQLAERLCVRPQNITGMLQRAKHRRDKAGEAVEWTSATSRPDQPYSKDRAWATAVPLHRPDEVRRRRTVIRPVTLSATGRTRFH
jgi:hypothetical protein